MPITDNMDICFGSKSNKEVWNTFFLAKLGLRCACRLSLIVEHKLLVPWPGIKPTSPTWEGELSTTGPPGKSLEDLSFPAIQNPKTLTLKMKYFKCKKYLNFHWEQLICYSCYSCFIDFSRDVCSRMFFQHFTIKFQYIDLTSSGHLTRNNGIKVGYLFKKLKTMYSSLLLLMFRIFH